MPAVASTEFVPMQVSKVTAQSLDDGNQVSFCVVLDEPDGGRDLVGMVGQEQALGLAAALTGKQWPRPMTYQFMAYLVRALDGRVRGVRLDRLVGGAYAATVEVEDAAGLRREVDARCSDALNLAVLLDAPVIVAPDVLDDGARRMEADSPEAALARGALTASPMILSPAAGQEK